MSGRLFQKRPSVRAVELANAYGCDELGVEVSEMDAVFCTGHQINWLPVSNAAAMSAADRTQSPIALDVGLRRVGMALDRHRSEFEIDPRAPGPAAERAVARCRDFRSRRQREADSAAVTCAMVQHRRITVDLRRDSLQENRAP
jgi:hypothetical protein